MSQPQVPQLIARRSYRIIRQLLEPLSQEVSGLPVPSTDFTVIRTPRFMSDQERSDLVRGAGPFVREIYYGQDFENDFVCSLQVETSPGVWTTVHQFGIAPKPSCWDCLDEGCNRCESDEGVEDIGTVHGRIDALLGAGTEAANEAKWLDPGSFI